MFQSAWYEIQIPNRYSSLKLITIKLMAKSYNLEDFLWIENHKKLKVLKKIYIHLFFRFYNICIAKEMKYKEIKAAAFFYESKITFPYAISCQFNFCSINMHFYLKIEIFQHVVLSYENKRKCFYNWSIQLNSCDIRNPFRFPNRIIEPPNVAQANNTCSQATCIKNTKVR